VPQCDLGRAVRADLGKAIQVAVLDRVAVVTSTERPVSNQAAVTPSLGGCDMPDVLVLALQAERVLRAKLFCHALLSLPSGSARALHSSLPTSSG
jgi:hypothetical protein